MTLKINMEASNSLPKFLAHTLQNVTSCPDIKSALLQGVLLVTSFGGGEEGGEGYGSGSSQTKDFQEVVIKYC